MAKKKKPPATMKLAVNALRRGEIRYDTEYTAPAAARNAVKRARDGYTVEVKAWDSGHLKMTCKPGIKKGKTVAVCDIKPAFKKAIRGR
jgi:hypothetical protein